MAISTFLQQLTSELAGKPEAQLVIAHYGPKLEQADAAGDKDKLILLQDQMHVALANTLNQAVDPNVLPNPVLPNPVLQPTFIDSLVILRSFLTRISVRMNLSPSKNEKLTQMVTGYALSTATAQELDPRVQITPLEEVLEALLQLGYPQLSEIMQFANPTLLVTPKSSFNQKQNEMSAYKKYERQADVGVWTGPESPFEAVGSPAKTRISVVDGATHMPHIFNIPSSSRFDDRKKLFKEHYQKKGMRLINIHEYVTLMQRSLHEYKQSGTDEASRDTSKIIDFNGNDTATCLDDEYLSTSPHVAYGCFNSRDRQVYFDARNADSTGAFLRGRPSVQVMEY